MIIGITGMIGSGKSTASKILKSAGWKVVDADKIGKDVVDKNPEVLAKLVKKFGDDILTPKGYLNRKKLAAKAFVSDATKKKLNDVVHPYLLRELKRQVKEYSKVNKDVVIDAALLLDWNLDEMVDYVIMVHAGEKTRIDWLIERGLDREDAISRQRRQLSYAEYRSRSDIMIRNNGSEENLKKKLLEAIKQYNN